MKNTYWNNNGKNQKMLNDMENAGWNKSYTKKSKAIAKRYYRYYNDGNIPYGMESMTCAEIEYEIEKQANEMIENEYRRFKKKRK